MNLRQLAARLDRLEASRAGAVFIIGGPDAGFATAGADLERQMGRSLTDADLVVYVVRFGEPATAH
jgi:hypothetical protein